MMSTISYSQRYQPTKIEGIQSPWDLLLELSNSVLGFPFDLLYSSVNTSWQASALVDNCFFLAESRFPFLAREKLAVQLIHFKFGLNSCDVYYRFVNQLFSNSELNLKYMQKFFSELGFVQIRSSDSVQKQETEVFSKEPNKEEKVEPKVEIKQEVDLFECIRLESAPFFDDDDDDDECFIQEYEVQCDPFSEIPNETNFQNSVSSSELLVNDATSCATSQSITLPTSDSCRSQSQCSEASSSIQSKAKKDRSQSDSSNHNCSSNQSDDLSNVSDCSIESRAPTMRSLEGICKKLSPSKSDKRKNIDTGSKNEDDEIRENSKNKFQSKTVKLENLEDDQQYNELEYGKYAKKSRRFAECETSSEKNDRDKGGTLGDIIEKEPNSKQTGEKDGNLKKTGEKDKRSKKPVEKHGNSVKTSPDKINVKSGENQKDRKCEVSHGESKLKSDSVGKKKKSPGAKELDMKLSFKIVNNCRDPRLKKRKLEGFDS